MSTIILNDEELKGKLLKAFTRILSCIYRQKELKIMRVNNILELVVNKPFKVGMNNFSCTMNACVKIGELEEVKTGKVAFYRVKVNTVEETEVKAKFTVAGFYPAETTNEDNGGSNYAVSYTFTNHLQSQIGKYAVTVHVPEGMETVKVTTPAKYDKQKLGLTEDGIRTVGASGKVAPAATSGVAFTYNAPLSGTMNIVIWAVAVGIGGFVFFDRLRKAKAE